MKKIISLISAIILLSSGSIFAATIFNETFDSSLGNCSQYNVLGSQIWAQSSYSGNTYAKMSGHDSGDFENEDWLITSEMDFSSYSSINFSYDEAIEYEDENINNNEGVYISTDYSGSGDPTGATWTQLNVTGRSDQSGYYTWFSVNPVDLSSYNTETSVYIAFKYLSSTTNAGTWEVDNVLVEGGTPSAPTATTDAATSVTHESATLNGTVNANYASTTVTFEWGETASYGNEVTADQSPVTGSSSTAVSAEITGLLSSTTYHYRVKAINSEGTTYGDDISFITNEPFSNCLYISEVSDDDAGGYQTAFVEIYNNSADVVDLEGFYIERWQDGSYNSYTYTLGAGVEIPAYGLLVVGRGADEATFETGWGIDFTALNANYNEGSNNLYQTTGRSYKFFHPTSIELDSTPAVSSSNRVIQETIGNWSDEEPSSNGTPGELDAGQTLPVTLSAFTATYTDNKALIEWTTATETDVEGFNLYRNTQHEFSTAEKINVKLIPGHGTSSDPNSYEFQDLDPVYVGTTYYYWLESVDFSGTTEVYNAIQFEPEEGPGGYDNTFDTNSLSCFPNPAKNSVSIDYAIKGRPYSSPVTVNIYNILGEVVKTKEINSTQNSVDISDLTSGIFFYQIDEGGFNQIKKMVIID